MCKRYVSWCWNVSVIIVCRTETIVAIEKSTGHICRIYASGFCYVVLFYLIRSVLFSKVFFQLLLRSFYTIPDQGANSPDSYFMAIMEPKLKH